MRRDRRDRLERLERLERRIPPPPDPPGPEKREDTDELAVLHFGVWLGGGMLEDVPEQHRDAELWSNLERYGPVLLWLEEEGHLGDGGKLPEAGLNLDSADEYPDDGDGRPDHPDEDAPGKRRNTPIDNRQRLRAPRSYRPRWALRQMARRRRYRMAFRVRAWSPPRGTSCGNRVGPEKSAFAAQCRSTAPAIPGHGTARLGPAHAAPYGCPNRRRK